MQQILPNRKIYYHMSTNNKSFLNMHYYLKDIGINNSKFHLVLLDPDLAGIDPHDPKLNEYYKRKVLRECIANYWYFLREVVRIPIEGSSSVRYELHRGNLALNFCMMLNLNTFLELPRQHYKTVSALARYLWIFNFGTRNSQISFLNKKMEDSKRNLQDLKDLRAMLPSYLRMDQSFSRDNKKLKIPDTIEKLQHRVNGNIIRTTPSARSRILAANLLRGQTVPLLWYDEHAFIPYNKEIHLNGVPAFKTASLNAERNGAPFGILITTTPGILTTDEGIESYRKKEDANKFSERWYDFPYQQIMDIINSNTKSNFVYIKYTYQQLGKSEEWFAKFCVDLDNDWDTIRREVLLEWSFESGNSPFSREDLELVGTLVREPIDTIYILGKFPVYKYSNIEIRNGIPKYPPLIGVDVSGGYQRDASAITCVCSNTTKVFAEFNSNCISTPDLAALIHELVLRYFPNSVVNIERNGGYGASVLAKLINSNIKKNLYYEIKDKVIEETNTGTKVIKKVQKTKIYGLDNTKNIRELLMQILRERMEHHKDKFISKKIFEELRGLEVKRSGRIEHSSNTHDDQIFSLLMALYIWYEGKNLMETYGIQKSTIKTDENCEEVILGDLQENMSSISEQIEMIEKNDELNKQLKEINVRKGILYNEWIEREMAKDEEAMQKILSTRPGREAYARQFNTPIEELESHTYNIPSSVFLNFNNDDIKMDDE